MTISRTQRNALQRLIDLEMKYEGRTRWRPIFIGQNAARALRTLDGSGLITIDKRSRNCYVYILTPKGRQVVLNTKECPA